MQHLVPGMAPHFGDMGGMGQFAMMMMQMCQQQQLMMVKGNEAKVTLSPKKEKNFRKKKQKGSTEPSSCCFQTSGKAACFSVFDLHPFKLYAQQKWVSLELFADACLEVRQECLGCSLCPCQASSFSWDLGLQDLPRSHLKVMGDLKAMA